MGRKRITLDPHRWLGGDVAALSPSERGAWICVMAVLAKQSRYGVFEQSLDRLARCAMTPLDLVRNLVGYKMLRGTDSGESEALRHVNRHKKTIELIAAQPGPVWYSSGMLRDEYLREGASEAGRKSSGRFDVDKVTVHPSTLEGAREVSGCPPSPLPISPPTTPSLTQPSLPVSIAAQSTGEGRTHAASSMGVGGRKRRERVLTDEQQRLRMEFSDWWKSAAWPRFHGGAEYGFESFDGAAVLRILRHPSVKWELETAKQISEFYLRQPEIYGLQGHPLIKLSSRINYFRGKMAQQRREGATHVIGQRDEFALPILNKRAGAEGSASGVPLSA